MNKQALHIQTPAQRNKVTHVWELLASIPDPEIPVINLVDLGVIRWVKIIKGTQLDVGLSPTYSGCPATDVIRASIVECMKENGLRDISVTTTLSPPWSSKDISEAGRKNLHSYGIAPPVWRDKSGEGSPNCPQCESSDVERLSAFGSTPCKSLYRCKTCLEPFDYFKCV